MAQYGLNLRWARISAILCLSSSNFFLNWAISEMGRKKKKRDVAQEQQTSLSLGNSTSADRDGFSPATLSTCFPEQVPLHQG